MSHELHPPPVLCSYIKTMKGQEIIISFNMNNFNENTQIQVFKMRCMSLKYGDDMCQALYSLHSVYFYALVFY